MNLNLTKMWRHRPDGMILAALTVGIGIIGLISCLIWPDALTAFFSAFDIAAGSVVAFLIWVDCRLD